MTKTVVKLTKYVVCLCYLATFIFVSHHTITIKPAYALCSCGVAVSTCLSGCDGVSPLNTCGTNDCAAAQQYVIDAHVRVMQTTVTEFANDLLAFERWMIDDLFNGQIGPAMAAMTTQMHAVTMYYTQAIGMFLDAQIQMDTQRLFRKLQLDAHIDYRPSEDFCWFGSNVKSLAGSQNKSRYSALSMSQILLARQTGRVGASGSAGFQQDYQSRWEQFVTTYCNPRDNNFQLGLISGFDSDATGLVMACDHDGPGGSDETGAEDNNRFNADISYTRLIEDPKTLEIDFDNDVLQVIDGSGESIAQQPHAALYNDTGPIFEPGHEEDVLAMAKNLYGHRVPSRALGRSALKTAAAQKLFLAQRSVIAKRNVAQSSFNAIVGLKASGTTHELGGDTDFNTGVSIVNIALTPLQTRRFLGAIVRELMPASPEVTAGNILEYIGYSPSYFSQLEILAKRIYQNPDFYANLYDTPANVSRKKVAMQAIELMVDREIYESQLRREMNVSVLLASQLRSAHRAANKGLKVSEGEDE